MNDKEKRLIKAVSSNLIRAQKEENKDISQRNRYLEQASFDSVHLSQFLLETGNNIESSRYLFSAAHSYEKVEAFNQAMACYDKIIEIAHQDFLDQAQESLSSLYGTIHEKNNEIDLKTKDGKISAIDFLIWKHHGITTTKTIEYFAEEFDQVISPTSVRSYARELEERKRVIIWGGPQGREYHIYPNVADLATRKRHYGEKTIIAGSIESRITDNFLIDFENWQYNKEFFILNGNIIPKMVMAVDMKAFVQNLMKFTKPGFSVKALGKLENFTELAGNGYRTTLKEELDVIDSNVIFDGSTDGTIYERIEN